MGFGKATVIVGVSISGGWNERRVHPDSKEKKKESKETRNIETLGYLQFEQPPHHPIHQRRRAESGSREVKEKESVNEKVEMDFHVLVWEFCGNAFSIFTETITKCFGQVSSRSRS